MLVPVQFKRGMSPYNAGEVAGFPRSEADRLIKAGFADEYQAEPQGKAARLGADKMVRGARNKAAESGAGKVAENAPGKPAESGEEK